MRDQTRRVEGLVRARGREPHWRAGDHGACAYDGPSAEGRTDVEAAAITRADFLRIAERHPDLLMAVTQQFSRRLSILTNRMLSAMSEDVAVRLAQLLVDFAAYGREDAEGFAPLDHPLTHEAMAQIIGASRPHTSTVLRDLESMGFVRRRSDRGLLVRPSALARVVRGSAA